MLGAYWEPLLSPAKHPSLSLPVISTSRSPEFPPLSGNVFMEALPQALRSASTQIGLARPSGIHVVLDDARRDEFAANETVVEAVHPCTPEALEKVMGLSGHFDIPVENGVPSVSIVATLRREFNRQDAGGLKVFWHLRAVRLPPPADPDQLSLFG